MQFQVKKLETCFADAENYEYRIGLSGARLHPLLASRLDARVRVNLSLRRPVFLGILPDGTKIKGMLVSDYIRVGYPTTGNLSAAVRKANFESWLEHLDV